MRAVGAETARSAAARSRRTAPGRASPPASIDASSNARRAAAVFVAPRARGRAPVRSGRAQPSCAAIASRKRSRSSGPRTRTTWTALYGCSSRQRSIAAWNRLSRPFMTWRRAARSARWASMHQCFLTLYQMSAACSRLDASASPAARRRRGAGRVRVDPRAGLGWVGEMLGARQPDVAVRRRQRDVAHARGAGRRGTARRPHRLPAIGSQGMHEAGELVDRVRNRAQPRQHRPLAEQHARQLAGRERRRVADFQADHRTRPRRSADRDRRARLAASSVAGSPDRDRRAERRRRARAAPGSPACRPGCGRSASASCRRARSARRARRRARRCRRSCERE